jgi:hypothetical protein
MRIEKKDLTLILSNNCNGLTLPKSDEQTAVVAAFE